MTQEIVSRNRFGLEWKRELVQVLCRSVNAQRQKTERGNNKNEPRFILSYGNQFELR